MLMEQAARAAAAERMMEQAKLRLENFDDPGQEGDVLERSLFSEVNFRFKIVKKQKIGSFEKSDVLNVFVCIVCSV